MIPFDVSNWGQRVWMSDGTWGQFKADKWVVHWPGAVFDKDPATAFRNIEAYHIDFKGWKTIAYNYGIAPSGAIYRLRGENESGATSGDAEPDGIPENKEARAVLFLTNGSPTLAQGQAFARMWAADPLPVIGHRQVHEMSGTGTITTCPGDNLIAAIESEFFMSTPITVPEWLVPAWDRAVKSGFINAKDDHPDDPNSIISFGRLVALFDRVGFFEPTVSVSTAPHDHPSLNAGVAAAQASAAAANEALSRVKSII